MEKCFVTMYEESVNNPDSEKFGEIKVNVVASTGNKFAYTDYGKIYSTDTDLYNQYQQTTAREFIIDTTEIPINILGNGTVCLTNKYNLKVLNLNGAGDSDNLPSTDIVEYLINLQDLRLKMQGDIAKLSKLTSIVNLYIGGVNAFASKIFGDISVIANMTSVENISIVSQSGITGNIKDLGPCINLGYINMSGTSIVGSLEEYVAQRRIAQALVDPSVTTGSLSIPYGHGKITFNGNPIGGATANTLSWTATTITFNGTTINA